jgi:putative membrane protein
MCYALFWGGGVVSYLYLGGPPADSRWTAPLFLFLACALTVGLTARDYRLPLMTSGILGLAVEVVGVRLGFPFGRYAYTPALRPFVLDVPLAIGFAWLILFAYVKQMLQRVKMREPWLQLCGASWMVLLDLLIDPLASGPLGYWIWEEKGWFCGVPLVNFLGWFGISLVLFVIFQAPWPRSEGIYHIGLSIVLFFSLIALARVILPALVAGLILCLIHGLVLWQSRLLGDRF